MGKLSTVKGQERATTYLSSLIGEPSFRSLLFTGPGGVGKKFTALSFFYDWMGISQDWNTFLDLSLGGKHPDVLIISPEDGKALKVAQVRELFEKLRNVSFSLEKRLVLIESCETLTPSAVDALLKLLEEGEAYTCFILLATSTQEVLHTLRARCMEVPFQRLSSDMLRVIYPSLLDSEQELYHLSKGSLDRLRFMHKRKVLSIRDTILLILLGYQEMPLTLLFDTISEIEKEDYRLYFDLSFELISDAYLISQGLEALHKGKINSLEKIVHLYGEEGILSLQKIAQSFYDRIHLPVFHREHLLGLFLQARMLLT